jgi:signal transduction histidine kinase
MLTLPVAPRARRIRRRLGVAALAGALCACAGEGAPGSPRAQADSLAYEHPETQRLVELVEDAARLVERQGEAAFEALAVAGGRWRQEETYIFVLDLDGNMLVHPDGALQGRNQLDLQDVNGRPIIRGLLHAATSVPDKSYGWYHYEWPVPGGLLPRWKSSYVRLAAAPSGRRLVVGSGVYNDRMERAFVVDMVNLAVGQVETLGEAAFPLFRDRTGPFIAKDAYVFVVDPRGVELVNPAFPNLEGRNLLDVKDAQGKPLVREMLAVVESRGSGWVDYLWPKPGDSVSTRKSTYVRRAQVGGRWLLIGAGVYLADAPTAARVTPAMTAPELMALVRQGAAVFEQRGEAAFPELRTPGSKWFRDDTYFFVWTADGTRLFHAADPTLEGRDASGVRDIQGRPYGRMFLEVAASPSGEGWVHYMYPEPGGIFPQWKSTFLKRVRSPAGGNHLIGAGIYHMEMDEAFIEDLVQRAAALVAARGRAAFEQLRQRTGPFVFMDTYVFVTSADGTELVNPAQPSLEGQDLSGVRDVHGKALVQGYIAAALRDGSAWVEYHWYRPGHNTPARKRTYVRSVRSGADTWIVGSGYYLED